MANAIYGYMDALDREFAAIDAEAELEFAKISAQEVIREAVHQVRLKEIEYKAICEGYSLETLTDMYEKEKAMYYMEADGEKKGILQAIAEWLRNIIKALFNIKDENKKATAELKEAGAEKVKLNFDKQLPTAVNALANGPVTAVTSALKNQKTKKISLGSIVLGSILGGGIATAISLPLFMKFFKKSDEAIPVVEATPIADKMAEAADNLKNRVADLQETIDQTKDEDVTEENKKAVSDIKEIAKEVGKILDHVGVVAKNPYGEAAASDGSVIHLSGPTGNGNITRRKLKNGTFKNSDAKTKSEQEAEKDLEEERKYAEQRKKDEAKDLKNGNNQSRLDRMADDEENRRGANAASKEKDNKELEEERNYAEERKAQDNKNANKGSAQEKLDRAADQKSGKDYADKADEDRKQEKLNNSELGHYRRIIKDHAEDIQDILDGIPEAQKSGKWGQMTNAQVKADKEMEALAKEVVKAVNSGELTSDDNRAILKELKSKKDKWVNKYMSGGGTELKMGNNGERALAWTRMKDILDKILDKGDSTTYAKEFAGFIDQYAMSRIIMEFEAQPEISMDDMEALLEWTSADDVDELIALIDQL